MKRQNNLKIDTLVADAEKYLWKRFYENDIDALFLLSELDIYKKTGKMTIDHLNECIYLLNNIENRLNNKED